MLGYMGTCVPALILCPVFPENVGKCFFEVTCFLLIFNAAKLALE